VRHRPHLTPPLATCMCQEGTWYCESVFLFISVSLAGIGRSLFGNLSSSEGHSLQRLRSGRNVDMVYNTSAQSCLWTQSCLMIRTHLRTQFYLMVCTHIQTQFYLMVGTQSFPPHLSPHASSCYCIITNTLNQTAFSCATSRAWQSNHPIICLAKLRASSDL
jgi:hypothetical protein